MKIFENMLWELFFIASMQLGCSVLRHCHVITQANHLPADGDDWSIIASHLMQLVINALRCQTVTQQLKLSLSMATNIF